MVRLKGIAVGFVDFRINDFNSTMVRLKVAAVQINESDVGKFQFHYGTIKRKRSIFNRALSANFNSTMVRLKDGIGALFDERVEYFNSTMVRLKALVGDILLFPLGYFNSTMVRLKAYKDNEALAESIIISIPLWYD